MLRPVKLDAAGNPRSKQSNKRRLDDPLPIEEVISVGFVLTNMDPPPDLRQDHKVDVFVLKTHCVVGLVGIFIGNAIGEWIWIYLAAAALIYAFFEEYRILVGRLLLVGRQGHRTFPRLNVAGGRFGQVEISPGHRAP